MGFLEGIDTELSDAWMAQESLGAATAKPPRPRCQDGQATPRESGMANSSPLPRHIHLAGQADRLIRDHPAHFAPVGQWLTELGANVEAMVAAYRDRPRGFVLRSTFDDTESPFFTCSVGDWGAYRPDTAKVPEEWQAVHNALLRHERFGGVTWVRVYDGDLFWEEHAGWLARFEFGHCQGREVVLSLVDGIGVRAVLFAAARLLSEIQSPIAGMSTVDRQARLLVVHWLLYEAKTTGETVNFEAGPWHVDDGVTDGDFYNAGWVDVTTYTEASTGKLIQCRQSAGVLLRNTLTRLKPAEPWDRSPTFDDWTNAVRGALDYLRALPPDTGGDQGGEPPKQAAPGSFTPTESQVNILQALAESHATIHQVDIVARSGHGADMVKTDLAALEAVGFVTRPHGKRKGYALTDAGRAHLAAPAKPPLFPH